MASGKRVFMGFGLFRGWFERESSARRGPRACKGVYSAGPVHLGAASNQGRGRTRLENLLLLAYIGAAEVWPQRADPMVESERERTLKTRGVLLTA